MNTLKLIEEITTFNLREETSSADIAIQPERVDVSSKTDPKLKKKIIKRSKPEEENDD